MDQTSRKWFDEVYHYMRVVNAPFGAFSCKPSKSLVKARHSDPTPKNVKQTYNLFKGYYKTKPPEEAFIEEKEKVLEELVPELQKTLPGVETAVMFGKVRGDIDIGLLTTSLNKFDVVNKVHYIKDNYPIVDWSALESFMCPDGSVLVYRIAFLTMGIRKASKLNKRERGIISRAVENARVLWGDEKELDTMRNALKKTLYLF